MLQKKAPINSDNRIDLTKNEVNDILVKRGA